MNAAHIVSRQIRHLSRVFSLKLQTPLGDRHFILKSGPGVARQAQLASQAREALGDDPRFFLPRCFVESRSEFFVVEQFKGRPLDWLCVWRPPALPFQRARQLQTALSKAAIWLRRYHDLNSRVPLGSEHPYVEYLNTRRSYLSLLSEDVSSRFIRLVESAQPMRLVTAHGDFSPHNVLVGKDKICVIDFGLAEWTEASPAWDLASMVVGLERIFHLSRSSITKWSGRLGHTLSSEFITEYGAFPACPNDFLAAAALRHFVGHIAAIQAGEKFKRIARWHAENLEEICFTY